MPLCTCATTRPVASCWGGLFILGSFSGSSETSPFIRLFDHTAAGGNPAIHITRWRCCRSILAFVGCCSSCTRRRRRQRSGFRFLLILRCSLFWLGNRDFFARASIAACLFSYPAISWCSYHSINRTHFARKTVVHITSLSTTDNK